MSDKQRWSWSYTSNGVWSGHQYLLRSVRPNTQGNDQVIWWSITKSRLFKYIENFTTKNWKFQISNLIFSPISAQNIDCGYSLEPPRGGGSYEYPESMFLSRNKKNNVYPCKPQFYYIKVGLRGSKLYRYVFVMFMSQRHHFLQDCMCAQRRFRSACISAQSDSQGTMWVANEPRHP